MSRTYKVKKSMGAGLNRNRVAAQVSRNLGRAISFSAKRTSRRPTKYYARTDRGPEVKHIDNNLSSTFEDGTVPYIVPLNLTTQGTTNNATRVGNKFTMTSCQYRLTVANSTANLATVATFPQEADTIRVALVYDKQTNGANPTIGAIWDVGGTSVDPFCSRNLDYIDRFSVLADDLVTINYNMNSATIERYVRMALPVRCDASAGAITDIETGGLFLYVFDQNDNGANQSTILGRVRVQYTDV